MNNVEKYNSVFSAVFGVPSNQVEKLEYKSIPAWDSVGQMNLITAIEESFGVELDPDDIIDFSGYNQGKNILSSKYGVEF